MVTVFHYTKLGKQYYEGTYDEGTEVHKHELGCPEALNIVQGHACLYQSPCFACCIVHYFWKLKW